MYRLLLLLPFLLLACEEVPPVVTPAMPGDVVDETPVEDQLRQVLIEEFTGVRCVNCPAGSAALEDLLAIHGERLVAVSIHAGFFADPSSEIPLDLQTPAGDAILNLLGEPLGYPTAVINRTAYINGDLQTSAGDWAGIIADELSNPPEVKIGLQTDYDEATRALTIDADYRIAADFSGQALQYTVLLTESNIIGPQDTPDGGVVDDYTHKHVLRDVLTNSAGELLGTDFTDGDRVEKSITYTLPADWNADNIEVITFVHRGGGEIGVVQAARRKLRE